MKTQISALISKAALLLMIISASILMPFHIHADTAVVMGTDVSLVSTNLLQTEQWTVSGGTLTGYFNQFVYHVTVQLDNNYVGYLNLRLNISYLNRPESGLRTDSTEFTRKVFINGDKAEFNIELSSWYATDPLLRNTTNATPNAVITEQGVTLLSELDSIQKIINILLDLYNSNDQVEGLLNNQLTQLQQIVSNTSLANQYLDTISKLRQWNIPLESYSVIQNMMLWNENKVIDVSELSYFNYPIFKLNANDRVLYFLGEGGKEYTFIFYYDLYFGLSNYSTFFNITNATIINQEIINERVSVGQANSGFLYKLTLKVDGNDNVYVDFVNNLNNRYYIPIYFNYKKYENYISTDFALRFGLSNRYLDDIHIIANGTQASNKQSQDLSSGTDSMQDQMDDLVGIEDSYNQQFNDSVNQIDFNNPLQQNAGLLGASNFVITVFNGLIANNPFSILIIIVCILLIGKKVIGK